jgi:hypothetical protein
VKQRSIKFLGGAHVFTQDELNNASRSIADGALRSHGHADEPAPGEVEKWVARELLDYLGLVGPEDARSATEGGTTALVRPPGDY